MKLSFDYIFDDKEKCQIKELQEYIQKCSYTIQYKLPSGLITGSASSFFENSKHNDDHEIEAILTLLFFIKEYLKGNGYIFIDELEHLLFTWNDYSIFWNPDQDFKALVGAEAFIRGLGWMLYKDQAVTIDDTSVNCYKGDTEKNITGIHDETLNNLLTGVIAKGKVKLPPIDNDRAGLVDKKNETFRYLAETLMGLRNSEVHHASGNKYDYEREKKSFFIRMDIIVLVMFIVQYQYDSLYKIVSHLIPKLENKNSDGEVINPLQIINEKYIPKLLEKQLDIIDDAYKFYSFSRDDEVHAPDSINVMLRPIQLSSDMTSYDSDDTESEDEMSEEMEEESLSLLDRQEINRLFLGGVSGSGKSTVVAKMIRELCHRWQNDASHNKEYLPIMLNIGDYDKLEGSNVENKIIPAIRQYSGYLDRVEEDRINQYVSSLRERGRLIIFFDGLNEAGNHPDKIINDIICFSNSREYCNCRYVVTSRLYGFEYLTNRFSEFSAYEICPLNSLLVKEQIQRASDYLQSKSLWERINQSPNLKALASNPQQLKLLIELMRDSDVNYTISNKTILFEQVVGKLIKKKYPREKYVLDDFNTGLCCVSGMMMEKEASTIEKELLPDYGKEKFGQDFPRKRDLFQALDDAKEMGIIEIKESDITFKHDSWKEFYQAVYVRDLWLATNDQTHFEQARWLRQILLGSNEGHIQLATGIICSLYELLDKDMNDRKDRKKYNLLIDLTTLLLTPPSDSITTVIIENDDQSGVHLQLPDNHFPQADKILYVLAMAISGMKYKNHASLSLNDNGKVPSDPKSVVTGMIMNLLLLYRKSFPNGMVGCNLDVLKDLFSISVISGSTMILDELFTPYWLRMWALSNKDFDHLMGIKSEQPDEDWQKRPYEQRVALLNENRALWHHLITDATNKAELISRLLKLHEDFSNWGFAKSRFVLEHRITNLLMQMGDHELIKTIEFCKDYKPETAKFSNYASLLLEDIRSMRKCYASEKGEISNIILRKLIQRINNQEIADFVWEHQELLASVKVQRALISMGYIPALEECRSGKMSKEDLRNVADIVPIEDLPTNFIEENYDKEVFLHWPFVNGESVIYKDNITSLIDWDHPKMYHPSVLNEVLKELNATPSLATQEVWLFFERLNQAATYTAFYAGLSHDKRKLAYCPTPNVCHVLSVSETSILLFSPSKGYTGDDNLEKGIETIGNIGQKVVTGDLIILEHNKDLKPLPSQERETIYGFKEGFVRAITGKEGKDYFIGVDGMKTDFYYHDNSGQYGEMEKGEAVSFFPSVNLRGNGKRSPMAYSLRISK